MPAALITPSSVQWHTSIKSAVNSGSEIIAHWNVLSG